MAGKFASEDATKATVLAQQGVAWLLPPLYRLAVCSVLDSARFLLLRLAMHFRLLYPVLALAIACSSAETAQTVGFSFDADDNLFNLPTDVILFNMDSGEEEGVNTHKFAEIRELLGKEGEWENYRLGDDAFRNFNDSDGDPENKFLKDLKRARVETPSSWSAPAYPAFVEAMSKQQSAEHTTIITARGHNPETIQEALGFLRAEGEIERVPAAESIWTVSNPNFSERFEKVFGVPAPEGDAASPSSRKAAVMRQLLDDIQATPLPENGFRVITPDAADERDTGVFHLWGFSDDDYGNFATALEVIQEGLDGGEWQDIKVTLYFTGLTDPENPPRTVVLRSGASPRPAFSSETDEWKRIVDSLPEE